LDGDKFQDTSKIVNIIFSGDSGFPTKQSQNLTLCEIMAIKQPTPRFLRWFEIPVTFSKRDQWTNFSEPGIFPLILDPGVVGS